MLRSINPLVFPIMGIGAFLLPRFFGLPNRQDFPESLALPPGWLSSAAFALLCAALVMAGFILESLPDLRMGHHAHAAVAWVVGVLVWAIHILPGVCRKEEE